MAGSSLADRVFVLEQQVETLTKLVEEQSKVLQTMKRWAFAKSGETEVRLQDLERQGMARLGASLDKLVEKALGPVLTADLTLDDTKDERPPRR